MPGQYGNFSLGSLVATGAATAAEVAHFEDVGVLVSGTFVGTCEIQVSFDGTTFVSHPTLTAKTAPFSGLIGFPCKAVRLNCTAYTSGTISGSGGGRDEDRKG